ncbi:MAG: hypothetical protein ACLP50_34620 [Solirubrobacteraceae bacterium]
MKPNSRILTLAAGVLSGALLAGGSYALGAGDSSNTIRACVVKSSHEVLIQKRCSRAESSLSWNSKGPQGVQGNTGPQGPPAATAWASILSGNGGTSVLESENLSVQQDGGGVYTLTASGPCTSGGNPSEVVTPSISGAVGSNGFPVAYVVNPNGPENVFQVVTGSVTNTGTFTQANGNFSVAVFCHQS